MKKERRWLKRVIKEAEELQVTMPWTRERKLALADLQDMPTARCA